MRKNIDWNRKYCKISVKMINFLFRKTLLVVPEKLLQKTYFQVERLTQKKLNLCLNNLLSNQLNI